MLLGEVGGLRRLSSFQKHHFKLSKAKLFLILLDVTLYDDTLSLLQYATLMVIWVCLPPELEKSSIASPMCSSLGN